MADEISSESVETFCPEHIPDDYPDSSTIEEVQMTLNAISGESGVTTLRIIGESSGHTLHNLIDTRSTINFI